MAVFWSEEIDAIFGGNLAAALTYLTPAGGAVATCVAPIGLRDRQAGWIGFTTSLGFGKKLDRIRRDRHVAMAFHTREHGPPTACALFSSRVAPRSSPTPTRHSGHSCTTRRSTSWAPSSGADCSGTGGYASTTRCGCRSSFTSTGS
jgi:hypothetical protein